MSGFDMNNNILQQMANGMPSNYMQMGGPQGGIMQMMMPGQQGQQSSQGNQSGMPAGFPFSGMMGGSIPQSYGNPMGNNPFYSLGGMMMPSGNMQSKPNDQTKAAVSG
jgi:hypothetical protein